MWDVTNFITSESNWWTKLLSQKHLKKTTFSSCFPKKSDSPLWKSNLSYRVFILDQIKWLIVNGSKVQVFQDEWVPDIGKLCNIPLKEGALDHDPPLMVKDLI